MLYKPAHVAIGSSPEKVPVLFVLASPESAPY